MRKRNIVTRPPQRSCKVDANDDITPAMRDAIKRCFPPLEKTGKHRCVCKACGKSFMSRLPNGNACSVECANIVHRQRSRDYNEKRRMERLANKPSNRLTV